jgi:hypothetical protein
MSSTSAPFGLRPAFHPSGLDRAQALANGIVSGYATDILKGAPVRYNSTAGTSVAAGTITNAAATGAWSGAFAGVEYTDTTGRRRVSNYWPASTTFQTGSCVAYFYNDQNIVYEIQTDATIAQTSLGGEYNFSATTGFTVTSGSNVTGLSSTGLGVSTAAANGAQGQMRVVDIAPYVDNNWGDNFVIVRVVNAQSQYFGSVTAIV